MKRDIELEATLVAKYAAVEPVLDERSRRRWAAAESRAIGYGGDALRDPLILPYGINKIAAFASKNPSRTDVSH